MAIESRSKPTVKVHLGSQEKLHARVAEQGDIRVEKEF